MLADDVLLYHTISCPDDYLDSEVQHSITAIGHALVLGQPSATECSQMQKYDDL